MWNITLKIAMTIKHPLGFLWKVKLIIGLKSVLKRHPDTKFGLKSVLKRHPDTIFGLKSVLKRHPDTIFGLKSVLKKHPDTMFGLKSVLKKHPDTILCKTNDMPASKWVLSWTWLVIKWGKTMGTIAVFCWILKQNLFEKVKKINLPSSAKNRERK